MILYVLYLSQKLLSPALTFKEILVEGQFNTTRLYTLRSESNQSTLSFSAYNGTPQLAIFKGEYVAGARPDSIMVSAIVRKMLIECFTECIKAAPGAKFPIILRKWNNEKKTRDIANVLTPGKDDNGVFFLEIKVGNGAPEKFPLRGDKNIERSGEMESDSNRSKHEVEALLMFLKQEWPQAAMMTRFGMQNPKGKGGQQKPAQRPASQDYSTSTSASEDDIY